MSTEFVIVSMNSGNFYHIFTKFSGIKKISSSRVFPNDYYTLKGAVRSIHKKYPKTKISFQKGTKRTKINISKILNKKKPVKRRSLKQIGKTNKSKDSKLKAKLPGKRTSKTGKVYYERRKNILKILIPYLLV